LYSSIPIAVPPLQEVRQVGLTGFPFPQFIQDKVIDPDPQEEE
jgi:hypothetical protein